MSGLCPFAVQKIIAPGSNDPAIRPRVAILHVAVSMVASLFEFFRDRSGGIESHFYITWTGKIEQYRNIYWQADANLDANDFAVSIETAGLGSGKWNPLQLRAIKRLLTWLNKETEGTIPLRKIDRWDGSGIGYHTLFGSPSHWTPVAKSCPGPERIKQFEAIIVPWMRESVAPKPPKVEHARLRIASLNIGDGTDNDKLADLDALRKVADVIGLQEAGDRAAVLAAFLTDHPNWAVFVGDIPGAAKVPVLYDKRDLTLDVARSRVVIEWHGGPVGIGAGPDDAGPKVLTHAAFDHAPSGRRVHVLNHHLIASHTRLFARGRKVVANRQADAFEREVETCRGLVFGTGDWNADANWVRKAVPFFIVDNDAPTFRGRQIDHIGHDEHPAVSVHGQTVIETSGSRKNKDHRSPVVTYWITVKETS